MRETSLYCRPDHSLTDWHITGCRDNAMAKGVFRAYGLLSARLLFIDSVNQLVVDEGGSVWHLPPDKVAFPEQRERDPDGLTEEVLHLLNVPRYIRKPANYVHYDDCPELRKLLSKRNQ